jgi:mono/diheme cytochrome c family protein
MKAFVHCRALAALGFVALVAVAPGRGENIRVNQITYHHNKERTGWNPHETELTPATVAGPRFGQLWQSPRFDSIGDRPPRCFASPLYVDRVTMETPEHQGKSLSVIYAVTDNGYAYAINARSTEGIPEGTIIWRNRLTENPSPDLSISTPVIDLAKNRIYITSGAVDGPCAVHALDIRSGAAIRGWPLCIDAAAVHPAGIRRNGPVGFPDKSMIQRGALNLSPDQSRLYVSFGGGPIGWIISIDTVHGTVASAFSATANDDEKQGGMWGSGGPSVDPAGHVQIATGANVAVVMRKLGIPGVYPESAHNWGQSVIRLRDDPATGFSLIGTYTPFNYAQTQAADIDLASSSPIVIDLDPDSTSTPHLLVLGGAKQGNAYLLNRESMPGSLERRPAPSDDPASDGSLLAPEIQPQFGRRGPLHIFGPYGDANGMNDQARSRSTPAYFRAANGKSYVFMTGSAKTGPKLEVSTPPGLVRLEIVTSPGQPAHLRIDQLEGTQVFHNPGSPVVTSEAGNHAIVWVLDENARRTASLYGPKAPRPVLYAFDAMTLELLWKSGPEELATSGRYNEPAVVNGLVIVASDRIQAFGLRPTNEAPRMFASLFDDAAMGGGPAPIDPAILEKGRAIHSKNCSTCHDSNQPGIPNTETVSAYYRGRIVNALRHGVMKIQATGLSDDEIGAVADYLGSVRASVIDAMDAPRDINVTGRALYVQHCITCHMPDGSGIPGLQPSLRETPPR